MKECFVCGKEYFPEITHFTKVSQTSHLFKTSLGEAFCSEECEVNKLIKDCDDPRQEFENLWRDSNGLFCKRDIRMI